MSAFICPFCGVAFHEDEYTYAEYTLPPGGFDRVLGNVSNNALKVIVRHCPECNHFAFDAAKEIGENDHFKARIYPQGPSKPLPSYIPQAIRDDYTEACRIVQSSPKAAATLCRRCLQGMIRDFWGIQKATLKDEIVALKQMLPSAKWQAIDSLRSIGNIGAHMEKDVNLIIDIEQDEAELLIKLIDNLLASWYIERHDDDELNQSITDCAKQKAQARNSANTP